MRKRNGFAEHCRERSRWGEGTLIRNLMFEYAIGLVAERRQEVGLAEAGPGGSSVPYS